MSLMDSKGGLSKAGKELFTRWDEARVTWSDAQSHEFETTYLDLIEQDVRSAMAALDQMNNVIQTIHSDCG